MQPPARNLTKLLQIQRFLSEGDMTIPPDDLEADTNKQSTAILENEPRGLGGWLVLVGIGTVISPFAQGLSLYRDSWLPLKDAAYVELMNPSSASFIPYLKSLVIFETVMSIILLLASIWMIYLYFAKHRLFPKVFLAVYAVTIVFSALDALIAVQIIDQDTLFDMT
jgi:hypothetical protein